MPTGYHGGDHNHRERAGCHAQGKSNRPACTKTASRYLTHLAERNAHVLLLLRAAHGA